MPPKLVHFVLALGAFYLCYWEQRRISVSAKTAWPFSLDSAGRQIKMQIANIYYFGLFSSVSSPPTDCILFLAIKTLTDLAPPSLITWPAAARVFVPNVWNIFLWWEETIWVQCTKTKVQLLDLRIHFLSKQAKADALPEFWPWIRFMNSIFIATLQKYI